MKFICAEWAKCLLKWVELVAGTSAACSLSKARPKTTIKIALKHAYQPTTDFDGEHHMDSLNRNKKWSHKKQHDRFSAQFGLKSNSSIVLKFIGKIE